MGVYQEIVSFDELFHQTSRAPIIVNDYEESSEEKKKELNNIIYTTREIVNFHDGDVLSNLASCECGEIVGEYNLGVFCQTCRTNVTPKIEAELEPIAWIRAPKGVAALVNPVIWTMLRNKFTKSGYDLIRWFCDTSYHPQLKVPVALEQFIMAIEHAQIKRGFNNFVLHFDQLMEILFNLKALGSSTNDDLYKLLYKERSKVFTQFLPLPNRALLVIEESNMGTYVDPIVTGAVNAIRMLVGIDSENTNTAPHVKQNRVVKALCELSEFYEGIYKTTFAKKTGIFRKHVFGSRAHFSFRAVISSLTGEHRYDEIHIPWGIGVSVLRIHLANKLKRRGYTPKQTFQLLSEYSQRYHPLLDELFEELIRESPVGRGLSVVQQRNPSLKRGSAQAVYITHVKKDPAIPTVSISILSVRGMNAKILAFLLEIIERNLLNCWESLRAILPKQSTKVQMATV